MHRHPIRSSLARLAAFGIALWAGFFLAAEAASACSFSANPTHTLDANAQATDATAPAAPTLTVVQVVRGKGPQSESLCARSASSCDDLGQIELQMAATGLDRRRFRRPRSLLIRACDQRRRSGRKRGACHRHPGQQSWLRLRLLDRGTQPAAHTLAHDHRRLAHRFRAAQIVGGNRPRAQRQPVSLTRQTRPVETAPHVAQNERPPKVFAS
jgi:hypothetical protein